MTWEATPTVVYVDEDGTETDRFSLETGTFESEEHARAAMAAFSRDSEMVGGVLGQTIQLEWELVEL